MTEPTPKAPAFQLVGDADAPVCVDGVCAIPGTTAAADDEAPATSSSQG